MKTPKPKPRPKRVWRISESAPMGEFVELHDKPAKQPSPSVPTMPAVEEPHTGGWFESSMDLQAGMNIIEDDESDDDIFEQFRPAPDDPEGRKT